jgi:CubicO group peptidase (beta-lactamase class C family)
MNRKKLSSLLFAIAFQLAAIPAATAQSQAQLAEIDKMAAGDFGRRSIGSLTIGVVSGKELVWTKSYGDADMEKKTPADRDTVYRIGSITKMFTAVMLEQLVEAGKVHYSDPAEKYFPELKTVQGAYPGAPPITLVQLATHTAGLSREPDNTMTYVTGGPVSAWEKILISALPHTHYEFEPGTRFSYSNIGFAILGAALSRAAGEPYMDYIPKHVLEPLGMTHSALQRNEKMLPHLSKGYLVGPSSVDSAVPEKEHEGRGYKMPNGAIYTTVGDLARFASFLMGLMGEGPENVLKSASLQRWLNVSAVPSNIDLSSGYGHGFMVMRRENYVAFGHGGSVAGYAAGLQMNRQAHLGVIVLTNAPSPQVNPDGLALRALDLLSK